MVFFEALALAMKEAADARWVDDETTFGQCRRQSMKRYVGIPLDLAQDEGTVLSVDQIGPMATHLAGRRTAK
jgi:hypothetical protein